VTGPIALGTKTIWTGIEHEYRKNRNWRGNVCPLIPVTRPRNPQAAWIPSKSQSVHSEIYCKFSQIQYLEHEIWDKNKDAFYPQLF